MTRVFLIGDSRRPSRCTTPRATPLTWVDYRDSDHASVQEFHEWFDGLPPIHKPYVKGQIIALRQLAALGRIVEGEDAVLEPVTTDPEVWELKWKLLGTRLRQYHAEPSTHPQLLVDLHAHLKHLFEGDRAKEKSAQDGEMALAVLRYKAGENRSWGMV